MRATPASSGLPVGRAFPKYTYHPRSNYVAPGMGLTPLGPTRVLVSAGVGHMYHLQVSEDP